LLEAVLFVFIFYKFLQYIDVILKSEEGTLGVFFHYKNPKAFMYLRAYPLKSMGIWNSLN